MSGIRVISERNLSNTIKKSDDGTKIEVAINPTDNLIKVTDAGLSVEKPKTVKLVSLGDVELGDIIID